MSAEYKGSSSEFGETEEDTSEASSEEEIYVQKKKRVSKKRPVEQAKRRRSLPDSGRFGHICFSYFYS